MVSRLRRRIRKAQKSASRLAAEGMRLSVLGLAAMAFFTHPGPETELAVALGLAGIACARLSSRRLSLTAARAGAAPGRRRHLSPECLEGACGACSGIGCDDTCGHPGRSRSRVAAERFPF